MIYIYMDIKNKKNDGSWKLASSSKTTEAKSTDEEILEILKKDE